ncbi:MAG: hypothetical protein IJU23_06760 [Proteobacteria bacterium]|nr:hypothetical protein [Pseudomonadota bacterium]
MRKNTLYLLATLVSCLSLYGCASSVDEDNNIPQQKPLQECGDGVCSSSETFATCPADCKDNTAKPTTGCGNGICNIDETPATCPQDCQAVCGDDYCDKDGGEDFKTCGKDCGRCGDSFCDPMRGESTETCSLDCKVIAVCGNNKCEKGETRLNCSEDCLPVCGDGRCELPETEESCAKDCASEIVEYESVCGDSVCDDDESNDTCPDDCEEEPELQQLSMKSFNALKESNYRFLHDYALVSQPFEAKEGEDKDDAYKRQMEEFFSFPFPSEVRTDATGHPNIANYPLPDDSILAMVSGIPIIKKMSELIPMIINLAQTERKGFSPIGATYFKSSVAIDTKTVFPKPEDTASEKSCFQLINVETGSRHYGERVPLYVSYQNIGNRAWADKTLVMRPVPGVGAVPGEHYVSIVGNCLSSNGKKFNQSNKLRYILAKAAPQEINDRMAPYVDALKDLEASGKLGMKIEDIRAMTGYETLDAAAEMDQMAKDLIGKGHIVTDNNGVAVGEWQTTTQIGYDASKFNVHIFHGQFETVNYIDGTYPYSSKGEGHITFDENGNLVSEGKKEIVNYTVVVPDTEMPAKGWPIAVYGHGTGGDADTHCRYGNDEGIVLINGGYGYYGGTPGKNAVPMAMIGFDACLQGKRGNGKEITTADFVMMLLENPIVVRESWRQTVIDMLVLYDILDRKELILPPIDGKKAAKNVTFDPSYGLYMGHSQGSQEGGMLLGLTDKVKNAFLSAGGGGVMLSFVDLHPDLSTVPVVSTMLNGKSVADIVGYMLGMEDGDISYDAFITNHIIQPLTDPLDPLNFTRRFVMEPPEGWEPKNIAQTIALGDQDTPQSAQFAMISSIGLPPIGKMFTVTDPMRIVGFTKSTGSSVSNNITTLDGKKVTGASMQFKYTGGDNPHFVIYNMNSARNAYVDFFRSVVVDGKPTVSISGSQEGMY